MDHREDKASASDQNDSSVYMTAYEAQRSDSLNSVSFNPGEQNDTAASPYKKDQRWEPEESDSKRDDSLPSARVPNEAAPLEVPLDPPPSAPSTSVTIPREVRDDARPSGASLFSVPSAAPPHSGVYEMPLEAFEFRDLDSGRTFYLDKRYWIKDVDTGKVYVLETGEAERVTSTQSGDLDPSGNSPPGTETSSIRVSDLISGQELSLEEFEEALGYFREAPVPQVPSPGSSVGNGEQDLATQAGLMVQRSMQSMTLAAHVSASWLRDRAAAARDRLAAGRESHATGSGSFGAGAISPRSPSGDTSPVSTTSAARVSDGHGLPVKVNTSKKPFKELTDLRLIQSVAAHQGVVWTMRFSKSGRYLATAGQDCVVAVWEVVLHRERERSGAIAFSEGASPHSASGPGSDGAPTSAPGSPGGPSNVGGPPPAPGSLAGGGGVNENGAVYGVPVLRSKPVRLYRGHKQDILDVAWSKTNFLLSASMDKTVRLWHVSMDECLRVFKHTDFVTAIDFHPSDDKLFVSGSIDGKVRLWNVPEQKVVSWQDVHDMVTALGYSRDGRRAVVGTMRGKCRFYGVGPKGTLEYEAQLDVKNKRGQHARGKKVTGLHFAPSPAPPSLLITSNDSRVRLYDGYTLRSKYKGHSNKSTQIKASFSPKGDYVICGSDDGLVYVWSTKKAAVPGSPEKGQPEKGWVSPRGGTGTATPVPAEGKDAPAAKEKNASYESFQVANDVITVALFGPDCTHRPLDSISPTAAAAAATQEPLNVTGGSGLRVNVEMGGSSKSTSNNTSGGLNSSTARGQVIVAAGYSGEIKIYENIGLPQWL